MIRRPPRSTLFPYTTLFRSRHPCTMRFEHGATSEGKLLYVKADLVFDGGAYASSSNRSEEHTSELQSRQYLVCRLLLEKKKQHKPSLNPSPNSILHTPHLKP